MTEHYDATPSNRLRVAYHGALADALLALAHASSRTLSDIIDAMCVQAADHATAVTANLDNIKARARELESAAVHVVWEQQPVEMELESVLTMYTLATDYRRLADDLAALAADLLQTDPPRLAALRRFCAHSPTQRCGHHRTSTKDCATARLARCCARTPRPRSPRHFSSTVSRNCNKHSSHEASRPTAGARFS